MRRRDVPDARRRATRRAGFVLAAAAALGAGRAAIGVPGGDRDAEALYAKNCASCHGDSGRGDGPSGLFLKRKPVDLRSTEVRKLSDDELFARISEGRPPMPGFGRRLTDEERRALVRYVRALGDSGR